MNRIFLILVIGITLCACGREQQRTREVKRTVKKTKKQKIVKPEKFEAVGYKYEGLKYGSPFSPSKRVSSMTEKIVPNHQVSETIENPESLKVTGVFSDKKERYAILSGINEFYFVKQGRLYNEDEKEMPGIAAIIKKDKVILITGENKMCELPIPE